MVAHAARVSSALAALRRWARLFRAGVRFLDVAREGDCRLVDEMPRVRNQALHDALRWQCDIRQVPISAGGKRVSDRVLVDVKWMSDSELLKPDVILSHVTGAPDEDYKVIRENGAFVSSTPDTELQMGLGYPVAFRDDIRSNASFGIDCHSNNSADILTQLRLGMQHARAIEDEKRVRNGGHPAVNIKVREAFNFGTIQGARAVGMEDKIGSLAEGKLADIVIFDTRSPAMVCAAEEDPLAALVLHASVRDIDMVIVDGKIRKENKTLSPLEVQAAPKFGSGKQIKWEDVVDEVLASRAVIKKRSESQSVDAAREVLYRRFSGN